MTTLVLGATGATGKQLVECNTSYPSRQNIDYSKVHFNASYGVFPSNAPWGRLKL